MSVKRTAVPAELGYGPEVRHSIACQHVPPRSIITVEPPDSEVFATQREGIELHLIVIEADLTFDRAEVIVHHGRDPGQPATWMQRNAIGHLAQRARADDLIVETVRGPA